MACQTKAPKSRTVKIQVSALIKEKSKYYQLEGIWSNYLSYVQFLLTHYFVINNKTLNTLF